MGAWAPWRRPSEINDASRVLLDPLTVEHEYRDPLPGEDFGMEPSYLQLFPEERQRYWRQVQHVGGRLVGTRLQNTAGPAF